MAFRNLLFDLDGTICNPAIGITRCIEYALTQLGEASPGDLLWCIGPPLRSSFVELLSGTEHCPDQAVALYRERYTDIGIFENEVYEGMNTLLSKTSDSHTVYLATSKPRVYAARILEHFKLTGHFAGVHGSELDGTRTDKSELISFILEQENLDPNETLMIGDRRHDLAGAASNQVKAIGVLWGFGSAEELSACEPHALCETPEELHALLRGH